MIFEKFHDMIILLCSTLHSSLIISDQEDLVRGLESSPDPEQEAALDVHEREVNHDHVVGAPADPDRLLFLDPDLVRARRDLEVHLRLAYRNQDLDRDRVTGVIRERAIEKDVTRRLNQDPNHGRGRSLRRDLEVGQEVSQAANDHGAMTIRHQHCRGKGPANFYRRLIV